MALGKESGYFRFRNSFVPTTLDEARGLAELDPYDYLTGGKIYTKKSGLTTWKVARLTGWDPELLRKLPLASSWISQDGKRVVCFSPKKE